MAVINLKLLGGFKVESHVDSTVAISVKKAKALFAYLAMHAGEAQSRDKLAALLWEESSDSQARHSLRQALADLRKSLPDGAHVFVSEDDALAIVRDTVAVDAIAFARLAVDTPIASLENALELYKGEFLEGFNPRAPAFEDWLMSERMRLREYALSAMDTLLDYNIEQQGADERAARIAMRLLAIDPLREQAHRKLMRLYARQGQYGAALKQYRICRNVLRRELGLQPEQATIELFQELSQRRQRNTVDDEHGALDDGSPAGSRKRSFFASLADVSGPADTGSQPELRQISVLSASLADSAAFGFEFSDDQRETLAERYFNIVESEIRRYGGVLNMRARDTAVCIFGLPAARSNDAERAVRAASNIHQALRAQELKSSSPVLRAQIGIASGRAMTAPARDSAAGDVYAVSGEVVNAATGCAARARSGETVIAASVYAAVADLVEAELLPWDGSDMTRAQQDWRLVSMSGQGLRKGAGFVGRRQELKQLSLACDSCYEESRGQIFLVRGEAGIGKTRLLDEFAGIATAKGIVCHKTLVLDFGVGRGQDAIRSLVRGLLGVAVSGSAERVRGAVEQTLATGLVGNDQRVFLNDLLELEQPPSQRAMLDAMDNQARRFGRRKLVLDLIRAQCRHQPVLLVFEDIHWASNIVFDYLAAIATLSNECPLLLVMTTRFEGEPLDPTWRGSMHDAPLTTIDLGPLRPDEADALAKNIISAKDFALARRCIERADGNPLFLEQLLRCASVDDVPDSVQSIVWSRLDRLSAADRRAAQAASIIGQRFSLDALRYLIDDSDYRCDKLLEERLIRCDGEIYLFAHALILEGVYASMLKSQRQVLHRRAADWFCETDAVLYAEHLERAEESAAAPAYLSAARMLTQNYRFERAKEMVKRGLNQVQNAQVEYELLLLQGDILQKTGATDAAIIVFEHALRLAEEDYQRCRVWIGLAAALAVRDRYDDALRYLDDAERVAGDSQSTEELAQIHYLRGGVLFPLGQVEECRAEHQKALAYASRAGSPELEARALSGLADAYYMRGRMITAHDHFDRCIVLSREHALGRIEVDNLGMRAITRFYQTKLDAAREDSKIAIELALQIGNQRAELLARSIFGMCSQWGADWQIMRLQSQSCIELARALGSVRFESESLAQHGEALVRLGEWEQGEQCLRQAYELALEVGMTYAGPWILGIWACLAADPERRHWALREGEIILRQNCVSHNYLHFYQYAIDAALADKNWSEAIRYAQLLHDYTDKESLPWSDFVVARGRALAAFGRGERGRGSLLTLRQLSQQAQRMGGNAALAALEDALNSAPLQRN